MSNRNSRIGAFLQSLENTSFSEGQQSMVLAADLELVGGTNEYSCINQGTTDCSTNNVDKTNTKNCDTNKVGCNNLPHPLLNAMACPLNSDQTCNEG